MSIVNYKVFAFDFPNFPDSLPFLNQDQLVFESLN